MVIRRIPYRLSVALLVIIWLAACGGEPAPAAQAPVATEAPAAAEAPSEAPAATEAPAAAESPSEAPTALPKDDSAEKGGGSGAEGSTNTSGVYVSDLGFRPDANGFGFPNYGGQGETNLTPMT